MKIKQKGDAEVLQVSGSPEKVSEKKDVTKKTGVAVIEENGGPSGPEPTRYGDWERSGIAKDF